MKKVYFVVLHYQALNETIDCLNSLKRLSTPLVSCHIIVVDNASPNKSGKQLEELYREDEQIEIVLSSENIGFAKGNNIGFRIAKENGAEFIILINNDTLIKDLIFLNKMVDIYEKTNFAVLGPDILSVKDQVHQNPMSGFDISIASLQKKILRARLILLMNKIGCTKFLVTKRDTNNVYKNDYTKEYVIEGKSNLVLQGSCLIFSRKYIDKFDGLYDGTFMYYEENILAYRCYKNNLKMVYSPALQIEHYRNISTNTVYNENNDKRKLDFFYRQAVRSLSCLLKMVKE